MAHEVRTVSTEHAFAMARRAAREEGVSSGLSTGADSGIAFELARRLGPGKRVVAPLVDSGLECPGGELHS